MHEILDMEVLKFEYQAFTNKTPPHFGCLSKFFQENFPKKWGGVLVSIFFLKLFPAFCTDIQPLK